MQPKRSVNTNFEFNHFLLYIFCVGLVVGIQSVGCVLSGSFTFHVFGLYSKFHFWTSTILL